MIPIKETPRYVSSHLTKKSSKDPEQHSPPSLAFKREHWFGFGWKAVAIGHGCGIVFGVGMGCWVLLMAKPQLLMSVWKIEWKNIYWRH